jgi:hypothetical protein
MILLMLYNWVGETGEVGEWKESYKRCLIRTLRRKERSIGKFMYDSTEALKLVKLACNASPNNRQE